MIKPVALVHGHYECRSLKQTVPILEELLALEIVSHSVRVATDREVDNAYEYLQKLKKVWKPGSRCQRIFAHSFSPVC